MSDFVQQTHTISNYNKSDSWVILTPIEQNIKAKIEAIGTPLKDWNIKINYGIKTGCNEAFIITTEKRNQILENCQTQTERERTAELIRPILRGRDIKRDEYEWANLWLINTHNGVKERSIARIEIENFPSIKYHLDTKWDKIETRADQGDTPYNLRNCAYMEDFFKPKIVWSRLMRISKKDIESFPRFCKVEDDMFVVDSLCFFSGENIDLLCSLLNTEFAAYYFFRNIAILDNGGMQMRQQYVEEIPLPLCLIDGDKCNTNDIYTAFGFTREEIVFIKSYIVERKLDILSNRRSRD